MPGAKATTRRAKKFSGPDASNQQFARGQDRGIAAPAPDGAPIVDVSGVNYIVEVGRRPLHILKDVALRVEAAEVAAIVGPSGSGKTSLLMLLAGLERATSGTIAVAGRTLAGMSEDQLAVFRRHTLSIVFQSFHLIPSLTALDNVALALEIASPELPRSETRQAAAAALADVGLKDRLEHRPATLSGGEQQRVGLARALITRPRLLLADEPTGNLDQETGGKVIELMFNLARQNETAVVLITHDSGLAARADRVFTMTQGELVEGKPDPAR
jgi:putative ABC transport system ATP-binding protein